MDSELMHDVHYIDLYIINVHNLLLNMIVKPVV